MKPLITLLLLIVTLTSSAQRVDRDKLIRDIQTLSSADFEGRKTGTKGNKMAADFISSRFKALGIRAYQDSFFHSFSFKNRQNVAIDGRNVIGFIKGKSDRAIVISAHYDHMGINDTGVFYGADDNASGVAAMLAFAEYFSKNPPKHTLLFVAFDAEESGLRGAAAFVKNPTIDKKSIALNVNMDMIAHNDKNELYASGTYKHPVIKTIIEGQDKDTGIKILFGHDLPDSGKEDWTMQSDQGPFAAENIPFVYFGVEDHKDYHKITDTFANINLDFYYNASRAILKSIIQLDKRLDEVKTGY